MRTARTWASRSTGTLTGASPSMPAAVSWTATRSSGSWRSSGSRAARWTATAWWSPSCRTAACRQAVEAAGGRLVRTPVGDKHILAAMLVSGAGLGGEKSGHVIVREHATSGDGIVTAIELLRVMRAAGAGLGELAWAIPLLPQQQRAIRVRHRDQWENDDVLRAAIADAERRLAPHGRILVRPSGTEPVLRVMVEGRDAAVVTELADAIAALAGERLH